MTFVPPPRTQDPEKLLIANQILEESNDLLANLKKWRKEQFDRFWYDGGQLRLWTEINDILIEMDDAESGQSGKFFASAVELVQLILAIDPGSLTNDEWHPKYDYTTDANGQIRMIGPEPQPE